MRVIIFLFSSPAKVIVPLHDIIAVRLKTEKVVHVDSFGSSTVLTPSGSGSGNRQVYPTAASPASPGSAAAINYSYVADAAADADDDALWCDDKEFTVHYARELPGGKLRNYSITFTTTDSKIVKQYVTTINSRLAELGRPKNLLLFLNPFGGKRNALWVYERYEEFSAIESTLKMTEN